MSIQKRYRIMPRRSQQGGAGGGIAVSGGCPEGRSPASTVSRRLSSRASAPAAEKHPRRHQGCRTASGGGFTYGIPGFRLDGEAAALAPAGRNMSASIRMTGGIVEEPRATAREIRNVERHRPLPPR